MSAQRIVELRAQIDSCDRRIIGLLLERARATQLVAAYRGTRYDRARVLDVCSTYADHLPISADEAERLAAAVMRACESISRRSGDLTG